MNIPDAPSKSEEELKRDREALLSEIADLYAGTPEYEESPSQSMDIHSPHVGQTDLFKFYHDRLADSVLLVNEDYQLKWLQGLKSVLDDIDGCFESVNSAISDCQAEKAAMIAELAGLDERSGALLKEQQLLERRVAELELQMNSVNIIKDVSMLVNHRDILVSDFTRFASIVKSLGLMSADARQHEHLKSRVCSVAVGVGMSAIDTYTKRMVGYINDQEGGTVSTVSMYGRFVETLSVVGNTARLFTTMEDREFQHAVVELEKAFSDARDKIVVPLIGDFMNGLLSSKSIQLSNVIRKSVYFVDSIAKQEIALFRSVFPDTVESNDALLSLFRNMGLGLYHPLRSAVISSEDVDELRESAEIIRLEVLTETRGESYFPFVQSVVMKLHRDIQERLIFRIESFIRDNIKGFTRWSPDDISGARPQVVNKTYQCIELITGVVDSHTFHEIANEAINACVDVVVKSDTHRFFESKQERWLFLISQLLALRERISLMDCEYSLLVVQSPPFFEHRGITDQFRRLITGPAVAGRTDVVAVRSRIESELKSMCDEFTASVIAMTLALPSDEEKKSLLSEISEKLKSRLTQQDGLSMVLLRPIVGELRRMGVSESVLPVVSRGASLDERSIKSATRIDI